MFRYRNLSKQAGRSMNFNRHHVAKRRPSAAPHRRLQLEQLETRYLLSAAPWENATAVTAAGPPSWTEGHIVVFQDDVNARAMANGLAQAHGFQPDWIFANALNGVYIPVNLPDAALTALARNPNVKYVVSNRVTELELAQVMPAGVERVGADQVIQIDGIDDATPVTVAVIDGGIDPFHPDLRVNHELSLGWYQVTTGPASQRGWYASNDPQWWNETYSNHGTPIAGIIGAVDNDRDVVGIAEGATIVGIKVYESSYIRDWMLIAALDHVAAHADEIAVTNISFAVSPTQAINDAFANLIDRGVVVVAAAGNQATDDITNSPQIVDRVVVVSAIHDSDGQPGGLGPSSNYGADDSFATFSNFGPRIDIAAPGVNIHSTQNTKYGSTTKQNYSGTSFAAPHVAGAAALYIARNGRDIDGNGLVNGDDVMALTAILKNAGWHQDDPEYFTGDPDSYLEPLLNVAGLFGPVDHNPSVAITTPAAGAVLMGAVTIAADASDDSAVAQVEFFVGGSLIAVDSDGSDGWAILWDSANVPEGGNTLTATATDDAGQSTSTQLAIFVDNIDARPIANSGADVTVVDVDGGGSELVRLDGSASADDRAILNYEWYVDSELIATGATADVDFAVGSHLVSLVVTDEGGQFDTDTVLVTVEAAPTASPNDMYVWDIAAETRTRGNKKDARIVVVVRCDSNTSGTAGVTDAIVSAASVTVALRNSVGALVGTGTGSTDANGRFFSGWFSNLANGTYVAEISSLTHLTFVWNQNLDPTANDSDLDGDGMPDQAFPVPGGQSILAAVSSPTTGNLQIRTPIKHSRLPMGGSEKNVSLLLTASAGSSATQWIANGSFNEVEGLAPSPLRRLAAVDAALAEFAQDWSELLLLNT
jgi:subtilisin family serine protease